MTARWFPAVKIGDNRQQDVPLSLAGIETLGLVVSSGYTAILVVWSVVAAIRALRATTLLVRGREFDPRLAAPERQR